jgi:hypothetical protein
VKNRASSEKHTAEVVSGVNGFHGVVRQLHPIGIQKGKATQPQLSFYFLETMFE